MSSPQTFQPRSRYTTALLPPPGPSISTLYHSSSSSSSSSPQLPQLFTNAMNIRLHVFCTEQGCSAANELDSDDGRSWHWVTYDSSPSPSPSPSPSLFPILSSSDKRPVACIRLVPPPHPPHPNGFVDVGEKPYVKVTRIAVVPEARGRGLAGDLCEEALAWAVRNVGEIGRGWEGLVLVHAQVAVEGWWERLGFRTDERLGRWNEEGIQHLGMWRKLAVGGVEVVV